MNTALDVKILKIYYTTLHPPTKKNNNQYPTMLSLQLPLSNTLRNLKFVYLKLDFTYLIFSRCFIVSRFFLDNQDYWTFHFKTLEPISWKEALCETNVLFFTQSQLSIVGVTTGHVPFLQWLFRIQWGKRKILIFIKCAYPQPPFQGVSSLHVFLLLVFIHFNIKQLNIIVRCWKTVSCFL